MYILWDVHSLTSATPPPKLCEGLQGDRKQVCKSWS